MVESSQERAKRNKYRRKKAMLKKVHKKAGIAFLCVMAALAVLAGRIAWINYNHGDAYSKAVLDHQTYTSTTIPYKRGQILTSNGNILAYSERVYNLILDPKLVLSDEKYKEPTLNALVQCFGLNRQELEQTLAVKKDSQYERLAMGLTSDEIADFKALVADTKNNPNIKGVWFENSYVRKYPFSTMACDVVGFASAANGGELGLESYYDDELSGTDGVSYSYVNDNLDVQETTKDAVDGNNIVTTIDYNVQRIIEKHIAAYNEEKPSSATAVLVMNPNNGEVLGMASYPYFDLNNPRSLESSYSQEQLATMSDEDMTNSLYKIWRNYCISETFEPGSTFKPFTVASGLEEGVTYDGDVFYCNGYEEIGGYTIRCHVYNKTGKHGDITLEQALMQSCNPAMMDIAARSLKTKREVITRLLDEGLYPYTKRYLGTFENHFSTIGLIGMNEAGLNAAWLGKGLEDPKTQQFTKEVLNHMRERLSDYQEEYGDLYNLEATPAESTAYRLAKHDRAKWPDIKTAGHEGDTPYYTNSSHLPVDYTEDIFSALDIQDDLQTLYTSGTVFHAFLGEKLPDWKAAASLVRKIAENYKLPYYTLSPTYSVCANDGYLAGEHFTCPICGKEAEVYSRITGYYRPVKNWNDGKRQEYKNRTVYDIIHSKSPEQKMKSYGAAEKLAEQAAGKEEPKAAAAADKIEEDGMYLFTTSTCPNCKMAKEMLAEEQYEVIDAERHPDLAAQYGIMQAPTLLVEEDGQAQKIVNASNIQKYVDEYLS
mgnify:CR=1 FL=1